MNVFDYLFDNGNSPDKKFILGTNEEATFIELYNKSLKLSNWLRNNLGENNKIILISHNSVFFLVSYLGIMKSGNICIPLNPTIEQVNLDYIIKTTAASQVFATAKVKSSYIMNDVHLFEEDRLSEIINESGADDDNDSRIFSEERMAQILFTSGSTGHPKGVMLSHKNLMANTDSIIQYLGLTSADIMEVVLPFYYCYGLSLLHTHLKVGGAIVLNNNFIFLGSILNDFKKYKCTGFAGVPSHFQILLRKSESFKTTAFPHLRYVTQAGGKLHNVFIKEFVESFPEKKFYVMYGQTEATARLSYLPPDLILKKIGSIGKGIPGVTLKIVDSDNKPVPKGEVGEIIAKGDNIMMGYLNDPKDNIKALQDGWLHTGDMGIYDKDGYIYIYARKKEIIKVGGKRISPKEIEEVVVSIPYVLGCKIKGVEDNILGEAIKAVIVIKNGIDRDVARNQIVKKCRNNLALYKIPSIFEFEDSITDPLKNK